MADAAADNLISEIRTVCDSERSLAELMREAAARVRVLFGAERVAISLSGVQAVSLTAKPGNRPPAFVFSHPIQSNGTVYGRLEVDLHQPALSPGVMLVTLRETAQLLALRAERARKVLRKIA